MMKKTLLLASSLVATVIAYPGMKNVMPDIRNLARQAPQEPVEMIGDLATQGATTAVGHTVQDCLEGKIDCYDDTPKVIFIPKER
jgi:hypothetical protein